MNPEIKFSKLSDRDFAVYFNSLLELIKADPLNNFIRSKLFMNFQPSPAQTVALKIIFGQILDPITLFKVNMETRDENDVFCLEERYMTEVELYEYMTDSKYDPDDINIKNNIDLIVGRRGGKSAISAMVSIYSTIKTNWKPYLKKTPSATVAILSHSKDFSDEILELIKTFIEDSPVLTRLIDKTKTLSKSTLNLKVPFIERTGERISIVNSRVTIKVGAASKKTTRGRAICVLLCDEIAHWNLEEKAAERDEDILRAVRPSLLQFGDQGMVLKLSNPGIKQGVLYNEYSRRHQLPKNFAVFKAPSWVWNDILESKDFAIEYQLDPEGFDWEYRANFVDSISNFISPEFVDLCVQKGIRFNPPEAKTKNIIYSAALDAAFKGDRFAFTLLGMDDSRIKQYISKTWQGSRQNPVKATEVASYIRNVLKEFKISRVSADQYAFQPLREIFDQFNITLEENVFTNTYKKKIYFNLKRLFHNQTIDILDDSILIGEVKQLQVEQTATGIIRIGHPTGGKDDCADCLSIAAYNLTQKANTLGIAEGMIAGESPEEVAVDKNGRAFDAPSAQMLAEIYGIPYIDNSGQFIKDESGKIRRRTEEDDDDEGNDGGAECIFV